MTTTLDQIGDLFLSQVSDYRLNIIYQSSGSSALNDYIQPWLLMAIDEFDDICTQDLTYDSGSQLFTETLTQKNMNILAQIMVKYWLNKEVQNVLQMDSFIQDRDFKTHSAAQNLREKQLLLNSKKEEISQLLLDYGYRNNDWSGWEAQNFA